MRGDIIIIIIKWVVKIRFKLVWLPVFSASKLVFSLPFKTSNNTTTKQTDANFENWHKNGRWKGRKKRKRQREKKR